MTSRSDVLRTAGRATVAVMAAALLVTAGTPLSAQEQAEGPPPESDADTAQQVAATGQEAEGRHEVDEGDTLWDLASQYLTDPFSWPRIFELNQDVVEDPHWIYPGEVLRLPGAQTPADVTGVEVAQREGARPDTARRPERPAGEDAFAGPSIFDRNPSQSVTTGGFTIEGAARESLVSRSVFFGAGFLADYEEVRPRGTLGRVIEENPLDLEIPPSARVGDEVMLSLDGLQAAEGDTLQAIRKGRDIGNGLSVVHSQGLLEVHSLRGDSARATVLQLYADLSAGDDVIPVESYTVGELSRLRSTEDGLRARVRALAVEQPLVATGDMVFLDVGSSSGVSVGDEFAVFSRDLASLSDALPRDRLGILRVVRVRGSTATARVTDIRDLGIRVDAPAVRVRQPAPPGT